MWVELFGPQDRLDRLEVANNADGRLEIFGVSQDGRIWHTWQTAPGSGWVGGWSELYSPADRLRDLRVTRNQDGRLEVFGISLDDRIRHTWQTAPNSGWVGGWSELYSPADRLRSLEVAQNADGRLEVFGVSSDDRIWHTWQTAPNNGWVGGWTELYNSGDRLRELRVGRNRDGRLEVFGVSSDDRIWHTWQTTPNGGWVGGWSELYSPGDRLRTLEVAENADGRLEVFGVSSDDRIWHTWQTAPGNGWVGGWSELYNAGDRLRELRVGRNLDGRLEVFGVSGDERIWHTSQVAPGNWAGGWPELAADIRVMPKVVTNPNVAIAVMIANMRNVFGTMNINVAVGPQENITVLPMPGAPAQTVFDMGPCARGQAPTADQTRLFANRNNAGDTDIVVYFVTTVNSGGGPLNGCAASPAGQPGVVVAQGATQWTLAHEVGHALGLIHVVGESCAAGLVITRLMTGCGTGTITGTPTLTAAEGTTMAGSNLIRRDRLRTLRVASNADGRMEVFGISSDERIWATWQTAVNNGWNEGGG